MEKLKIFKKINCNFLVALIITLILSFKKINIINLILFQNIVLINLNYKYDNFFLKKSHYVIGVGVEIKISDSAFLPITMKSFEI